MAITAEAKRELVAAAMQARGNAYAPYSGYSVGAALLGESGAIYPGVNVENAAYPTGMCAERTAVFAAVAQGERRFQAIAVVTDDGGTPCGSCRQVLSEFGADILVVVTNGQGEITLETTVGGLLPEAFGPGNLGK